MYSKHKDELGRLYNINKENSYSCRGCDIEPPNMTIDCPHCEQHNTILLEKYPRLDCTVQDLMDVFFETQNPIQIEKDGEVYIVSLIEGMRTLYLAEDRTIEDALILSLCRISNIENYHDKIKENVKKLFME